jgi:hypothetical protein
MIRSMHALPMEGCRIMLGACDCLSLTVSVIMRVYFFCHVSSISITTIVEEDAIVPIAVVTRFNWRVVEC